MILSNKAVPRGTGPVRLRQIFQSVALITACFAAAQQGLAAEGRYLAQSTPSFASHTNFLRAEDPSTVMEVSVWLSPRNRGELDALARDLYDAKSPNYRRWLNREDIAARFAPSAEDVSAVRKFLESQKLKLVRTGPNNFYIRMRGTAADVERAFQVKLNYYSAGGTALRANATDPYLDGSIADLVQSVAGLDGAQFVQHVISMPAAPRLRPVAGAAGVSAAASAATSDGFETVCFPGATSQSFTTAGTYPTAKYKGNSYRSGSAGCVYSPANVYEAYNLKALYKEGYTGTGQTIVILDWCGSPTIQQDANAFSKKYGLPELTSSNFNIIYPVPSQCAAPSQEINLDVEWAHAIAPGANIDLVVPASAQFEDTDEAWFYAVNYGLGNVISASYGAPEKGVPGTELAKEALIAEIGAVSGISSNFSSGDGGNLCGIGCTPEAPASTPYSTAVGGVSLALNANGSIAFQTGWESYLSILISADTIYDPPRSNGESQFIYGSGGGASAVFAKPAFQKGVPGKFRQIPDIAWLADPYTAVAVLISEPGQLPEQVWTGVGGTSVACPMFSALWAIANQEAGGGPLGQAAQYVYSMPAGTITDILPMTSASNVTAVIQESSTVTHSYNAAHTMEIDASLFGDYYSALWDVPLEQDSAVAISFGTGYGMSTAKGWDSVTGVGTPNPKAFADSFAPSPAAKQ
jgi:subtilase family serine protease